MTSFFSESDLQAYVERCFVEELPRWLPLPARDVRLLGAQVPCATGRIDLLGALNYQPVIVELKAETASEKVSGQLQRYRAAVEAVFDDCFWEIAFARRVQDAVGQFQTSCIVIAPDFAPNAIDALSPFAWLLRVEPASAGQFRIAPLPGTGLHRRSQIQLRNILHPLAHRLIDHQLATSAEQLPFAELPGSQDADL